MGFIGIIILFVLFIILKNKIDVVSIRVAKLENRLKENPITLKTRPEPSPNIEISPEPVSSKISTEEREMEDEIAQIKQELNEENSPLVEWLRQDWMLKLGSLLLFFSFVWLVTYAFMNDWVGPVGRISFGLLSGILIIALSDWRIKKSLTQGGILLALGGAIILVTVYAAREVYDFFTPFSALVIMALVPAYIAISALRYDQKALAILGLLSGAAVPLFLDMYSHDPIPLFTYLFVLITAYLMLIHFTGWRVLSFISFIIFAFFSLPYLNNYAYQDESFFFANIFTLLFFTVTILAIVRNKKAVNTDLFLAALSALYYLIWIYEAVEPEYQGMISSLAALVFVIGAYISYKVSQIKDPMLIYSGIAVIFLGAATVFELSGQALAIALTIEAFIISILSTRLTGDILSGQKTALLMLVPTLASLSSMNIYLWKNNFLHKDFFVLLLVAAAYLSLGMYFYQLSKGKEKNTYAAGLTAFNFIADAIYVLIIIRLMLQSLTDDTDTANVITLVIYTVIGLYFYLKGKFNDLAWFKIPGAFLLMYVGFRLLIVEIWRMDLSGRIIVFFIIGALLIASSLLNKNKKD